MDTKTDTRSFLGLGEGGKSRFLVTVYILISVLYLSAFVVVVIKMIQHPPLVTALNVFYVAGLLAFSLAAGYLAFLQITGVNLTSKAFLMFWIAAGWGMFSSTMKIYPWNIAVAGAWLGLGLLALRNLQRHPGQGRDQA